MVDSLGTHTIPIWIPITITNMIMILGGMIQIIIVITLHPVAATRPHTLGAVIITMEVTRTAQD